MRFDELSRLAVAVVVHRAAAVVGKAVQFLRQLHGITDARELYLRVVGGDVTLQLDTTIGIDGVDLIRGEFEIIGAERLRLVVHNLVNLVLIAVSVRVIVVSAVGGLASTVKLRRNVPSFEICCAKAVALSLRLCRPSIE